MLLQKRRTRRLFISYKIPYFAAEIQCVFHKFISRKAAKRKSARKIAAPPAFFYAGGGLYDILNGMNCAKSAGKRGRCNAGDVLNGTANERFAGTIRKSALRLQRTDPAAALPRHGRHAPEGQRVRLLFGQGEHEPDAASDCARRGASRRRDEPGRGRAVPHRGLCARGDLLCVQQRLRRRDEGGRGHGDRRQHRRRFPDGDVCESLPRRARGGARQHRVRRRAQR